MPKFDDVTLFFVSLEEACCVERRRVSSSGEAFLVRREKRGRCGALIN